MQGTLEQPATLEDHPHARAVLGPVWPPQGRPAHAYLFHGPPGAGGATVARELAAALLAEGAADPQAAAERVRRGTHPDLTWVTPSGAGEMLVGDVEQAVVSAIARTPFESARRVFVLQDAETMRDEVANRLLKALEEPPPFAHVILLARGLEEVLPTVVSRCQRVRFDPLPAARIEALLATRPDAAQPAAGDAVGDASVELVEREHERERLSACARLARGDVQRARWLASEEGRELRASARELARAALQERTHTRPWLALLERSRAAAAHAGEQAKARSEEALELLPSKERRRAQREAEETRRRLERRERTRVLDEALALTEAWLRDVWCVAEGAPELVFACDCSGELREDAHGRAPARLRRGVELVAATRRRLALNVAEELALEALGYRLESVVGAGTASSGATLRASASRKASTEAR